VLAVAVDILAVAVDILGVVLIRHRLDPLRNAMRGSDRSERRPHRGVIHRLDRR
jgi:hypothetical protein